MFEVIEFTFQGGEMETGQDARKRMLNLFLLSLLICGLLSFIKSLMARAGFSLSGFSFRFVAYMMLLFGGSAAAMVRTRLLGSARYRSSDATNTESDFSDLKTARYFTVAWSLFVVITVIFCILTK